MCGLKRYLEDNMDGWLSEQLEDYIDDDYLIFDCPGMSLNPILNLLNENSQIVLMMRIIKTKGRETG
jgi:hypothetical protein